MRFAYLNLKNHPRGNVILSELIKNNFIPSIIIEENSTLAEKNRNGIISVIDKSEFLLTSEIIKDHDIELFEVDNHNDDNCKSYLEKLNLDLVVLGDTRIITKKIREIPKIGVINSHPGFLPDVKGNNPYIWALIHDLPQGCSIHFIDENVDTGNIILRERINIDSCKSYPDLLRMINSICAKLMVKAVKQIIEGNYDNILQSELKFVNSNHIDKEFFAAPLEIKKLAIQKLENK